MKDLNSPIIIRLANEYDAAELMRLNTAFNGEKSVTEESIAHSIQNNDQEKVFVAECGNGLIGFLCVQLFKSFCYSRHYAEMTELFVNEEHRGNGVATQLLTFAEDYYSDEAVGGYQLFTAAENVTAQRLYESLGYLKTAEIMYRKRN